MTLETNETNNTIAKALGYEQFKESLSVEERRSSSFMFWNNVLDNSLISITHFIYLVEFYRSEYYLQNS